MANRSYIYTCDREPGGKDFYARGLGEYGWDIPLVHKKQRTAKTTKKQPAKKAKR